MSSDHYFGRYKVLTHLGQGAMATVYLAEDPSLNRLVAIKVIHSHLSTNTHLMERFTVEAKTAAALRNPNIVEIFDYGLRVDQQFLVMEYIDGPNLQLVLNLLNGQAMPSEVCAAIICQAAEGLVAAEKNGVVHRDIKPENMMFNSLGCLKIADFGIAHINEQNLTQTGNILGSPNFMAPEQIEGGKPGHYSDLFALGAVFYYALTGKKPFTGATVPILMRNICDTPHACLGEWIENPDPILEEMIDSLLRKKPQERRQSARQLSQQLRIYLNEKGIRDLPELTKDFLALIGEKNTHTVIEARPIVREKPAGKSGVPQMPLTPGKGPRKPALPDATKSAKEKTSRPNSRSMVWVGASASLIVLGIALAIFLSRQDQRPSIPVIPSVTRISLSPISMEIEVGAERRFVVEIQPTEAPRDVKWLSTDSSVASVSGGRVSAKRPGIAFIRVSSLMDSSRQVEAEVTVVSATLSTPTPIGKSSPPLPRPIAPTPLSPPPAPVRQAKAVISIISAPPFADVVVNGESWGATPIKGKRVNSGRYRLQISHRSYPTLDTTVLLKPGDATIKFRLFK